MTDLTQVAGALGVGFVLIGVAQDRGGLFLLGGILLVIVLLQKDSDTNATAPQGAYDGQGM